jgi:hypothetical protein
MNNVVPRFEFRTFGLCFAAVVEAMRCLAPCERIRESSELYIVSVANNNTKVRDDKMDIKVLVREEQGLEQWRPQMKGSFPMAAEALRDEVFPAFGLAPPPLERPEYTLAEFVEGLVRPHPGLTAVHVFKRRFGFTVEGCITEHAELLVNGAAMQTVAVEAEDGAAVLRARARLGLEEYENVNYVLAIQRIIGQAPLAASWLEAYR